MRHWLFKSEPDSFSYDDLVRDGQTPWDGVRNYQARNLMRDEVKTGDLILFYHSRMADPEIVGIAKVTEERLADKTALDPQSPYFDPKSKEQGKSRWVCVRVEPYQKFAKPVLRSDLKKEKKLGTMMVLQKGSRLSIQPVEKEHFEHILRMAAS